MKQSEKESKQLNCFKTIDELPIQIWFSVQKTGEISMLLKNIEEYCEEDAPELWSIWETMFNQYMERFGLSDEFMEDLKNKIELANMKADFIISGDKYFKTMIRVQEEIINANTDIETKPFELERLLAKMSKYYGFKLSSRDLTVAEYYSYLENIKDGRKES